MGKKQRQERSPAARHSELVARAVAWLRQEYGCGIVLSEQSCATGEIPDAIGWKGHCHSVIVECKVTRHDFLSDRNKPFRKEPGAGLGCERFYLTPGGLVMPDELPNGWGLLECKGKSLSVVVKPQQQNLRKPAGLMKEMNLLLASLRRVEVRIEPQTITEFLKWKNRLTHYNGGALPEGITPPDREANSYLDLM